MKACICGERTFMIYTWDGGCKQLNLDPQGVLRQEGGLQTVLGELGYCPSVCQLVKVIDFRFFSATPKGYIVRNSECWDEGLTLEGASEQYTLAVPLLVQQPIQIICNLWKFCYTLFSFKFILRNNPSSPTITSSCSPHIHP